MCIELWGQLTLAKAKEGQAVGAFASGSTSEQ